MNIYIYGNKNFKDEIHNELTHSNIKFKLSNGSIIKDINNLLELKNTIKEKPNDIYLIDDEKIIKNNVLNNKIKFLIPKDGIEEDFLFNHGIKDLSVDSLKEVSKYISQKLKQNNSLEVDQEIQNSIIDIVDEAYKDDEYKGKENSLNEEADSQHIENTPTSDDVESDIFDLDDELSKLLATDEDENEKEELELNVNLDEINNTLSNEKEEVADISVNEFSEIIKFDNDVGLENTTLDYDDENSIQENEIENIIPKEQELSQEKEEELFNEEFFKDTISNEDKNQHIEKGEEMDDKFSQLNSLNENDILDAISNISTENKISENLVVKKDNNIEKVSIENSNIEEISSLISKLLNNKTLEITIKVKD